MDRNKESSQKGINMILESGVINAKYLIEREKYNFIM